ncbi:MAG: DUF5723 family protein [Bacteroidota bacterium]
MITRKCSIRNLAVFALVMFSCTSVIAQQGRNINFLRVVPQSGYINPAIVPPYSFYIGLPALSSLKVEMKNTPFHYKDIFITKANDSVYLDTRALLNTLKTKNYFLTEFENEFLTFGFRVKQAFITINLSEKFNSDIMYPKEFMSLLINGNAQYLGTSVNAGGFDINVNHYHELALGFSYVINNHFTAGFRAKYLVGMLNIDTKNTDISLYSPDEFSIKVNTDIEINTSIPGALPGTGDSLGFNINGQDYLKSLMSFNNTGYAFDLGMQYMPNEKITLGLSVTDLGFINWKTGVRNIVTNKETSSYTFNGIDIGRMFNDSSKFEDQLNEVIDSLKKNLGLRVTYENYRSSLIPKIYLSGIFSLTPKDHFGALIRCDIFKGNLIPSFTLNYTREFGKAFSLMAGYSIATNSYTNFAFGFALNAGPIQLYILTDNVLGIAQLTTTRYSNTHFGINLVFGRSRWYNKKSEALKEENTTETQK